MLRLSNFLWILLLVGAFLALGSDRAEARTGLASWYGLRGTADGERRALRPLRVHGGPQDDAAWDGVAGELPWPLGAGDVNDRGPYVGGRDLDLSQGAAEYIGLTHAGVDYVEYSHTGGYDPGTRPTRRMRAIPTLRGRRATPRVTWQEEDLRGAGGGHDVRDRRPAGDLGGLPGCGQRHSEP